MRIVVNTLSSISKGAVVYLENLLPLLAQHDKKNEYLIILDKKHWGDYYVDQKNFKYRLVRFPSENVVLRLIWENIFLPVYLFFKRADLLFTPANICNIISPCKRVIVVHNLAPFYPEVVRTERLYQKIRLNLLRKLTKFCVNKVDFVILISQHSFVVLEKHIKHADQCKVIYHGKNEMFKPDTDPATKQYLKEKFGIDGEFVLNVSHFYRFKNFENLIKAYEGFKEATGKDFQLVLAGKDSDKLYYKEIKKLIAEKNAAGRKILHLGNLGYDDLIKLLSNCSLFVFPSLHEVCPNTLIEAMACGAPSLVSSGSAMPEICDNAVLYFDPHNAEDIERQMLKLYNDKDLRENLLTKAFERANYFNWQKCADEVYNIFCSFEDPFVKMDGKERPDLKNQNPTVKKK
jgi:glycosyltransferase involved in cell wall biosynthesis